MVTARLSMKPRDELALHTLHKLGRHEVMIVSKPHRDANECECVKVVRTDIVDALPFDVGVCKLVGSHTWHDHSHAGPDSGDVNLECSRCHESHYVILY